MAGASMKDIKLRIRSVESTKQITSAMQLVASSKLRRARQRMEDTRPYMQAAKDVIADIASHRLDMSSPFFREAKDGKKCVVLIAGDRGLAGHYNAAVFKMADDMMNAGDSMLPIGKKALDRCMRKGIPMLSSDYGRTEQVTSAQCRDMARLLIDGYLSGQFGEVVLVYTTFVSSMTQDARQLQLLPVVPEKREGVPRQMIMEPSPAQLLKLVMPDYLAGCLYAAVCDAFASEMASRRNAMDSATKNAEQMISDLSLHYNRARQGSITQEITEIVAGAEN